MSKKNDKLATYKKIRELQKNLKEQTNKTLQDSLFNLTELYNFDRLYDYTNILQIESMAIDPFEQIRRNLENISFPILNINSMSELAQKTMQQLQPMINLATETNEVFNHFNNSIFNTSREVVKIINQFSESITPNIPQLTLSNLEIHTSLLNQIQNNTNFLGLGVAAYESFNNLAFSNYNKLNNIITGSNLNFQHIFNDIINKPLFSNIDFNSISEFYQTFSNSLMDDFTYIENKTEDIVINNGNISNIIEENFDYRDFIDEHIKQIEDSLTINNGTNNNTAKIIVNNLNINYYQNSKQKLSAKEILLQIFINFIINIICDIAIFHYTTIFNEKNDIPAISKPAMTSFEGHNTITENVEQYNKNNTTITNNAGNIDNANNTNNIINKQKNTK